MSSVSVVTEGNRILTSTPYLANFAPAAKKQGGRWDASRRVWSFDARDEVAVRELLVSFYGTDGIEPVDLVTIRVPLSDYLTTRQDLVDFGRIILSRRGRDEPI